MEHIKWDELKNQKQWKEQLTSLIKTSDAALFKSILVIYESQTLEERQQRVTKEENKKGFGAYDAEFLTSIAEQIKGGYPLTEAQKAIARNKMVHYWKQLMVISKRKIEREKNLKLQQQLEEESK